MLVRLSTEVAVADGPERALTWLAASTHRFLDEYGRDISSLPAISIGLPGPVEFSTGKPAPIMPGWHDFDVPEWMRQHFNAPALVNNDVNISAPGERSFTWPWSNRLIFLKIVAGIGSGITSGGRLQRGAPSVPAGTGFDFLELVKHGNLKAIQAVRQAGRDIGEVLSGAMSLLNPSVIAISGSGGRASALAAGVRERVLRGHTVALCAAQMIRWAYRLGRQNRDWPERSVH